MVTTSLQCRNEAMIAFIIQVNRNKLNLNAMNTLRNRVQLIGNVGQDPEIKNLEGGRKLANISLATNDSYTNDKGEKITDTQWHRLTAWGNTAELIEKFVTKGKEIAITGKLSYKSYDDKNGEKRYQTEITISEIQFIGKA